MGYRTIDASKAIPIAGASEDPAILDNAWQRIDEELASQEPVGIFPEGGITRDGEIQTFRPGIERILESQPVPVVPMALCNLWGSLFSRSDPVAKRRPRKLWARIELRIGAAIPATEATVARVEAEVRALRGDDR